MLIHVENIKFASQKYLNTLKNGGNSTAVPLFKTTKWFNKKFAMDLWKKLDFDPDPESDPEIHVK